MYSTILPEHLHASKQKEGFHPFPRTRLPLHSMIAGVGVEHQKGDRDYNWHGLRRGNAEFSILQYTLSGRGHLRVGTQEWILQEGQCMLLHLPADNHYWLAEGDEWEFFYLTLYGAEINRHWRQAILRSGPVIDISLADPLMQLAASIVLRGMAGEINSAWRASALAYEMAMALLGYAYPEGQTAERLREPEIARAVQFIRQHYHKPIGLDDMATAAGLSRYHFARKFTGSEGLPPGEFLIRERIRKAVSLLQTTALPLVEISEATGFTDVNYFCRVFRKIMNISPGAFRRSGMY